MAEAQGRKNGWFGEKKGEGIVDRLYVRVAPASTVLVWYGGKGGKKPHGWRSLGGSEKGGSGGTLHY